MNEYRKKYMTEASVYKHIIDDVGHCELCGSKRSLEVHHIVPRCTEIEGVDLEDEENLIVLCGRCHSLLTPRSVLCKYGIAKTKQRNERIKSTDENSIAFYKILGDMIEAYGSIGFADACDVHDYVYLGIDNDAIRKAIKGAEKNDQL